MYKKVPIFRCTTPSTGKRLGEVIVGTLYLYNVPTTTSPNLFPVDGVVHRNIRTFLYIFSSRFWSVKSFKILSECESRIVGRSPNFAKEQLVKCATKVALLHKVSIQSCTQNRASQEVQSRSGDWIELFYCLDCLYETWHTCSSCS